MSKKQKDEIIDLEEGKVTTFSNADEEPREDDQLDENSDPNAPVSKEDEPEQDAGDDEETEVEFEPSTPEEAGCRAHGDTVLKYPHLPNPDFEDFRAESILHCKREQPDVMEVQEEVLA